MQLTRRQFGTLAGCLAATAAIPSTMTMLAKELSVTQQDIPIIDCHQHLWDLEKFKLPWIEPGTLLGRSYVTADYQKAIEGTGIKHAVYMEVDVDPSQQQAEAEHLIEICKGGKAPTIAAVISGRPAAAGFKDYITPLARSTYIKGVRQVLHGGGTPAGFCLSDDFVRGIRLLGELGLSFDLCMRAGEIADGAKLAEKCPDTRFVLDHCGNADVKAFFRRGDPRLNGLKFEHDPDAWRRDIEKVAAQKNAICKISGIIARVPKQWSAEDLAPVVNHCLDSFGPDRVVFGSDWPVCLLGASLKEWVASLREIARTRPQDDQRKLLFDTANRFYTPKL